ncbi:hypothetical protein [Mucilaginibacter sp. KACC 22063]|uniref:hypothetical protein n=1 Tax=Mucilaginibacter sp. KACC 22063 TaxID=3025666 RepID=UPI0023668E3E|nr:hypothetical protein [Mucilaginibacter sp. KACC 22063]WDF54648.1 hypothetical protein PQ461_17080 [Mucilaginibacter sp. KACC 22063]
MNSIIKMSQKLRTELWWLIVSVDFNYSRICIADHELAENMLTIWLEDKHDYKNTLEECLQINIPIKQFAKLIRTEELNSYPSTQMHQSKKFLYKTRTIINDAINWYLYDATLAEQQLARETTLKHMLTNLVESEIFAYKYAN